MIGFCTHCILNVFSCETNVMLYTGICNTNLVHLLQYLNFGKDFDRPIDPGAISDWVEEIISIESFDQPVDDGVLPKSLTKLHLQVSLIHLNRVYFLIR